MGDLGHMPAIVFEHRKSNGMKEIIIGAVGVAIGAVGGYFAATSLAPSGGASVSAPGSVALNSDEDIVVYASVFDFGGEIKSAELNVDNDVYLKALDDALNARESQVSDLDARDAFQRFQTAQQEIAAAEQAKLLEEANAAQAAFFEEKRAEDGVVFTESGLAYKVLTEGEGAKPTADDVVSVHYTGKFLDGTTFDSSVDRGMPAEFGVTEVIAGWTEALQLMSVGSKYQLYIPYELAYGARGRPPGIPPAATLVFDVELLDIVGE